MVRRSVRGGIVLAGCLGLMSCQSDIVYLKDPITVETTPITSSATPVAEIVPQITVTPPLVIERIQKSFKAPLACQATVLRPAVFKTQTKNVLVQEGVRRYVSKSALTKTNSVKIQTMPARFEFETVPAVYKTIIEKVPVKRPRPEMVVEPPQYRTVALKQEVKPAHTRWQVGCLTPTDRSNPKQINKSCLINEAPQVVKIEQQVVDVPPKFTWHTVPAEYEEVERKILVKPGQGKGRVLPAEYRTVDLHHVTDRWTVEAASLTNKYQTIPTQVLERPAQVLQQISLCEAQMTETDIQTLQQRLAKVSGQDLVVSGKMDGTTRYALLRYQEQQRLAQGAITFETLQALGF